MIIPEALRTALLATGLSLLLMMAYVALKFSTYDSASSFGKISSNAENIITNKKEISMLKLKE